MELNEKLDKKYNNDKKAYQKTQRLSQNIKDLEQQLKMLTRAIEDAKIKQMRAKEDGDTSLEKEAQAEIEAKGEEIKKGQTKLDKIKEVIEKNKSKVDGYIEELKKEPGFEEHVNSILEKRYNRQLAKALKEEQQVNTILDLCQKNPTLANNLRGMVRAQEELDKLNREIEPLDPEKDKDKLDEIYDKIGKLVSKKNSNMHAFMEYCTKKDVNVDREFLDRLISEKSFVHDKEGNIQVKTILDLCQKHPTLANNLWDMVRAQEKLDKLRKKIDTLDSDKDKDKLDKIQSEIDELVGKKNSNMNTFMAYCTKNDVNVDRKNLAKLISKKDFEHCKQEINVEKTLKNMSKGYKKRILAYQVAINRIPNAKISAKNEGELGDSNDSETQPTTKLDTLTSNPMQGTASKAQPPVPKFKWYEFRKRFNAEEKLKKKHKANQI